MNICKRLVLLILLSGFWFSNTAFAQDNDETSSQGSDETEETESKEEMPSGILPIPNYKGDIWKREYLFGDLNGERTTNANNGIQFDVEWIQFYGSVVDGGLNSDGEYGGGVTVDVDLDLMQGGLLPGALIQIRTESRYCCSTLYNASQVGPNNTAMTIPLDYDKLDSNQALALTNFTYIQFLSEKVGLIAGKVDTYGDGDANEFATGRGRTQFMNWSFGFAPATLTFIASGLAAGVIYMPNHNWTFTNMLFSATDCTFGDCFKDLGDKGKGWVSTITGQYRIGDKPGGINAGLIYVWDKDFTVIDTISPLPGVGETKDHSHQVSMTFWQYISVLEDSEGPLNLRNRKADLRGWGIFGRLSWADKDTNPWKSGWNIGIGGRGIFASRPDDAFGVGYFSNKLEKSRFLDVIGFGDTSTGAEIFYNFALTPAIQFTADAQWLKGTLPRTEDSTVLHARLLMTF